MPGRLSTLFNIFIVIAANLGYLASGWMATDLSPRQVFLLVMALTAILGVFGFWKPRSVFSRAYENPNASRTSFSDAIKRHIELYRSMGYKYRVQAYMLESFAAFTEGRSEQFIRAETVLDWAAGAPSIRQRYDRLLTVRHLACALNAENERHQVPPADAFGHVPRRRRTCHIYTDEEISRLLRAATQLTSRRSIQPVTFISLISLIAATGLRVSEALKLQLSDITDDGLLIRATKFQKSRLVPLHESARHGLQRYLSARKRTKATASTVFISRHGTAIPYSTLN